jgi:hypothetical protein
MFFLCTIDCVHNGMKVERSFEALYVLWELYVHDSTLYILPTITLVQCREVTLVKQS